MTSQKIAIDDYLIEFCVLESGIFDFFTTYKKIEYGGRAIFKYLSQIEDFDSYLTDQNSLIKIDCVERVFIKIQLPVPYTSKFESVMLEAEVEDDFEKLRFMIESNSNELTSYVDESVADVLEFTKKIERRLSEQIAAFEKIVNKKTYFIHLRLRQEDNKVFIVSNSDHENLMVNYLLSNYREWIWESRAQQIKNLKKQTLQMLIGSSYIQEFDGFVKLLHKLNLVLTNNSYVLNKHYYLEYQEETFDEVAIIHKIDEEMLLKKYKIVHVREGGDMHRIIYFDE